MKIDDFRKLAEVEKIDGVDAQQMVMEKLREMGIDPENFYQELEMSSHYVNTHRDVSYYRTQVNLHSHNFMEILYCRSCSDVEYLIGSNRYRLQPGDIVCVPPGTSHRPIFPDQMTVPYERDVLWLSVDFLLHIQQEFPEKSLPQEYPMTPFRTADTRWAFLGDLFRKGVIEVERGEPGWELAVAGNTMTILSQLFRAYSDNSMGELKREKRELLDEITAYIEEHYADRLTLGDVAKQFFVSDSTVSHMFKKKMGVSLYRYVTQRRLIAAKNHILKGLPLEIVAEQVGFADYSSFYRAFKGEFGISPRQFRIQNGIHE